MRKKRLQGMTLRDELALAEYQALQAEKNQRMITFRLGVWSAFFSLAVACGLMSAQAGNTAYAVGVYPLLIWCLAMLSGHNEAVLQQLKNYLLVVESRHHWQGYEHYNKKLAPADSWRGIHGIALRYAFLITDALALGIIVLRLINDQFSLLILPCVLIGVAIMIATGIWLRKTPARHSPSGALNMRQKYSSLPHRYQKSPISPRCRVAVRNHGTGLVRIVGSQVNGRAGYAYVILASGTEGWIPLSHVTRLSSLYTDYTPTIVKSLYSIN